MITFNIKEQITFDGEKFSKFPGDVYRFENTLLALKKWESLYQKPWFGSDGHSSNELNYYFKCMNVDDKEIYPELLTPEQRQALVNYMYNPMGAHRLPKQEGNSGPRYTHTAEFIYSQCIIERIDLNWAEKQNLNQLLTIIGLVNLLQTPPKEKSPSQMAAERTALNAKRLAEMNKKR